jgi:hypothetical protein
MGHSSWCKDPTIYGLCNCGGGEINGPVLSAIEDARVFYIERDGDTFVLREGCDDYFAIRLSKEEFRKFIEELQELENGTR